MWSSLRAAGGQKLPLCSFSSSLPEISDRKRPFLRVRTESTRKIRSVQDSDWLHGVDEFYITAALTEAQLHEFLNK